MPTFQSQLVKSVDIETQFWKDKMVINDVSFHEFYSFLLFDNILPTARC